MYTANMRRRIHSAGIAVISSDQYQCTNMSLHENLLTHTSPSKEYCAASADDLLFILILDFCFYFIIILSSCTAIRNLVHEHEIYST